MNKSQIITKLIELGYPEAGAALVADKLAAAAPDIQELFIVWQETGEFPSFAVREYTVKRLQDEHGMNPVASLLTLDWLLREPEKALASLAKGHDRVILPQRTNG